jgi:glycine/D-amino acid oxidase-like deaminating enzyme
MLGSNGTCEFKSSHFLALVLTDLKNGGHCQPMIYASAPEIGKFELRNYEAIKSLIAKENIPCVWKSRSGCHAYMAESMFKIAVAEINNLKTVEPELGEQVMIITKESTNPSLEDLRIPNAKGAAIQGKAASLWPYKFVSWILERLISSGSLNLQTNTPVTNLQKVDSSWIIHTPRGMLATKKVLLTTNAYTSHLLPKFSDLIVPVRGEMSSLIPPKSMKPASVTNQPLKHSYVFIGHGTQNINQDDYLIQRPFTSSGASGELMFGGGRSYASKAGVGVSNDSSIDPPAAAYLRRELNVVLDLQHDKKELKASYEWSGIMGYSRDEHPWVGEVSEELGLGGGKGLFVSGGFTGHGMPNTWLSAKAAVGLMMGKNDVDLPSSYYLTKGRVEKARALDEVAVADAKA